MKIYIAGGSANSIAQRTQANAQISVMVPTGATLEISKRYMPLKTIITSQEQFQIRGARQQGYKSANILKTLMSIVLSAAFTIISIQYILPPATSNIVQHKNHIEIRLF
ncbi:MAG: hypothetical protein IPL63_19825 [Saprospiraceae bacterium]|nr:hypothetical protein [Saprospiraceae bacterium]